MNEAASDVAHCDVCGAQVPLDLRVLRCPCGGTLTWWPPDLRAASLTGGNRSIWRYRHLLPPSAGRPLSLGEGGTPLVEANFFGHAVLAKLEFCLPSGAYKDRGSAVLAAALARAGVRRAVDDSSGNAGASLAAYLAAIGCDLTLFVPPETPAAKLRQARVFGASIRVASDREAAAEQAAAAAVDPATIYASHALSPYFLAGTMTLAFELWEDLDGCAPDDIIVPAGNGLLVLGLWQGFRALASADLIMRLPRLHAAQAAACAPLVAAWESGGSLAPVAAGETAAGGARVACPPRGETVLTALRATGGAALAASEEDITRAQDEVAGSGWWIEPTAALAVAALMRFVDGQRLGRTVVVLTGSGLKTGFDQVA